MTANIRAAFARTPDACAPAIVGVRHSPYLDEVHEMRMIDAEAALR